MKAIKITFDEDLLAELDADEEVRRKGRSAVLRRAVVEYLKRRRRASISRAYRRAYADTTVLDEELEGWEEQGRWLGQGAAARADRRTR